MSDDVQRPGPSDSAADGNIAEDVLRYVHKEKDFLSLLSCTPGQCVSQYNS